MAKFKEKINASSVLEALKDLSKQKIQPVYYIFGEDNYSIENTVNEIKKAVEPLVLSDFDKETVEAEKKQNLSQILDLAMAFPFGGGKKLIVVNNFDNVNDKKELSGYVKSPPEFTILVAVHNGKITDLSKEPFSLLLEKKYLYEAKTEKGEELVNWLLGRSQKMKLNLSEDNARSLIEIVGDEKSLLEIQLQKIIDYAPDKKELKFEDIKKIASPTKQYSIFELQDAVGQGLKPRALEIAYSLLDSGQDIVSIINMISKYILTIAQILELVRANTNDNEGAKMMGVSWYYYINCKKARFFMSDERLINASRALLDADISVKTTAADPKNILLVLISQMMK